MRIGLEMWDADPTACRQVSVVGFGKPSTVRSRDIAARFGICFHLPERFAD